MQSKIDYTAIVTAVGNVSGQSWWVFVMKLIERKYIWGNKVGGRYALLQRVALKAIEEKILPRIKNICPVTYTHTLFKNAPWHFHREKQTNNSILSEKITTSSHPWKTMPHPAKLPNNWRWWKVTSSVLTSWRRKRNRTIKTAIIKTHSLAQLIMALLLTPSATNLHEKHLPVLKD